MGIPLKEKWFRKIFGRSPMWEVIPALFTAWVAFDKAVNESQISYAIAAVVVFLCILVRVWLSWKRQDEDESIYDLEGCLHALHGFLQSFKGGTVRVTIHIPTEGGKCLVQALDYVGVEPKNRAGRKFPPQCGAIGQAFRQKEIVVASRASSNWAGYQDELITEWHYTPADAKECNRDVKSWLAIPLSRDGCVVDGAGQGEVEAIVYADSTKRNFFDNEQIIDGSLAICSAIARFVKKRYFP